MNRGLWNRILKGMKNNELAILTELAHNEQVRRAEKRISEGRYIELDEAERELLREGDRDEAIDIYRERTNCPLVMAEMIVDMGDAPQAAEDSDDIPIHVEEAQQ